jgi:ankyrin repeat protein
MKVTEDVTGELGRLPSSLAGSYDIIYKMILNLGPASKSMAVKALKWLICAKRSLQSQELIAAISVDSDGKYHSLSNEGLLDACCNMIVLDSELNIFRFAHLSVKEYLECSEDYSFIDTHALALERSLDTYLFGWEVASPMELTVKQNSIFRPYADFYWPVHCQVLEKYPSVQRHRQKLKQFFFQCYKVGPLFTEWISALDTPQEYSHQKHLLHEACSSPPTPLFVSCYFGLVSLLDDLNTCANIDWNQLNNEGSTGLHLSADEGHETVVKVLVKKGVDINAKNRSGQTALHLAARKGHQVVVQLLLESGAAVDTEGRFYGTGIKEIRITALHIAVKRRDEAMMRLLLENGAKVDAKLEEEEDVWDGVTETRVTTALNWAAQNGDAAAVRLLIQNGANIDVEQHEEEISAIAVLTIRSKTALHLAARRGHGAVVQLLLEHGANVDVEDQEENNCAEGPPRKWLKALGQLINRHEVVVDEAVVGRKRRLKGRTALHMAARAGSEVVVRLLLENGASVDVDSEYWNPADSERGVTALHMAAKALEEHEALVRMLLKYGAKVNSKMEITRLRGKKKGTTTTMTALQLASRRDHKEVMRALLENGASGDAKEDGEGYESYDEVYDAEEYDYDSDERNAECTVL